MQIENQVTIKAPATEVWRVFTDASKASQWINGFKHARTIAGEPLQVGSKHEMTFEERGREMIFMETVTQVIPEKEYSFNMSNKSMTSKNTVLLIESGSSTKLVQKVDFKALSFGFKLMLLFMKGVMNKKCQGDLDRLKELIESGD